MGTEKLKMGNILKKVPNRIAMGENKGRQKKKKITVRTLLFLNSTSFHKYNMACSPSWRYQPSLTLPASCMQWIW